MDRHLFISHASEDKESFVRPLALALQEAGARVWFDEFDLSVGDSLRESIEHGLRTCAYGLVVLSPSFFAKRWTAKELNALFAREVVERRTVILPIWHGVSFEDVAARSPLLADQVALNSADGIPSLVQALLERLQFDQPYRQIEGEQRVLLQSEDGRRAQTILRRTVQVGIEPLVSMWARVPVSSGYAVSSVTPGKFAGYERDLEMRRAVVRYEPPLPPGTVFTQEWLIDAEDEYADPDNAAGVRSSLAYERFTLAVETDFPGSITNVRAATVSGMDPIPLAGLRSSTDGRVHEITIERPAINVPYSLHWDRA